MSALPRLASTPARAVTTAASFRAAMRNLPGGVSIVTTGKGAERTGFTATSVSSLSVDPPTLLVCVNRASSAWPVLARSRAFGVSVVAGMQAPIAERFAGWNGEKGAARFAGAEWSALATGTPLLDGAVVVFDCTVEEIIERHSHAIVLGAVQALRVGEGTSALVYWRGAYDRLGMTDEEAANAFGFSAGG